MQTDGGEPDDFDFDPGEQRDILQERLEEQGRLDESDMREYFDNMVLTLGAQVTELSPLTPEDVADELESCARIIHNEIADEDSE